MVGAVGNYVFAVIGSPEPRRARKATMRDRARQRKEDEGRRRERTEREREKEGNMREEV